MLVASQAVRRATIWHLSSSTKLARLRYISCATSSRAPGSGTRLDTQTTSDTSASRSSGSFPTAEHAFQSEDQHKARIVDANGNPGPPEQVVHPRAHAPLNAGQSHTTSSRAPEATASHDRTHPDPTTSRGRRRTHLVESTPLYACNVPGCTKVVTTPRDMRRHTREHMDRRPERPYACGVPGCDHESLKVRYLVNHMALHTGEPSRAERKKLWRAEILRRKAEKRHACGVAGCGRTFAQEAHLAQHVEMIHPGTTGQTGAPAQMDDAAPAPEGPSATSRGAGGD